MEITLIFLMQFVRLVKFISMERKYVCSKIKFLSFSISFKISSSKFFHKNSYIQNDTISLFQMYEESKFAFHSNHSILPNRNMSYVIIIKWKRNQTIQKTTKNLNVFQHNYLYTEDVVRLKICDTEYNMIWIFILKLIWSQKMHIDRSGDVTDKFNTP